MENLIGLLNLSDTQKIRSLTGCDEINNNDSLKSFRAIENKIIDLWLGGNIRHFEAREALTILRRAAQQQE